jgi:hypothetical protein
MQFSRILFYEKGYQEPIDARSIKRILHAFPRSYSDIVEIIVENSEDLTERAFKFNVALLLPSFGMTRRGAFAGMRVDKEGNIEDQTGVIDLCWKEIGDGLQNVRKFIDENVEVHRRSRRLMELSTVQRDHVIEKTCGLFTKICEIGAKKGQIRSTRVGASKILFAALPEVALPVDNLEWDEVFRTDDYGEVLTTMTNEIDEWERKTENHLDDLDTHQSTTLPSIYNVMAMSIRPLEKLPISESRKKYLAYLEKSSKHVQR